MSMRIVHLSASDLAGGAARAAFRLHRALSDQGIDSRMLVRSRRSLDDRVIPVGHARGVGAKVKSRWIDRTVRKAARRYARTRPAGFDPFTDDRCGAGEHLLRMLPDCDIINLHWVKGLIDFRRFFAGLPPRVRIVWTLHDMNALTGGCHYDHECGRFMTGCGACPQLGSTDANDLSAAVFARKRAAFEQIDADRMRIVTPSRWLAGLAERSPLLGRFNVEVIPNGIDTDAFAPRDRILARRTLGLPEGAKVLAFVAHGLEGRRKGFDLLQRTLANIADVPGLHLLSAGAMHELHNIPVPHLSLGPVDQERLLSLVYSAADVFVIPSLQDNLPNTVIESLACGTPVVGFDVGGIPEMVEPGRTGWLAPVGDAAALADAIAAALEHADTLPAMARTCRAAAVDRYDLSVQAQNYTRFYRAILDNQPLPATVPAARLVGSPA